MFYWFFLFVMFFLTMFIIQLPLVMNKYFGIVSLEQILFFAHNNIRGTSPKLLNKLKNVLIYRPIIYSTIVVLGIFVGNIVIDMHVMFLIVFLLAVFLINLIFLCIKLDIKGYIFSNIVVSDFYEKNFVSVKDCKISKPKTKKNLLLIYLESFDDVYTQKGVFDEIPAPELLKIKNKNLSFEGYTNGYAQNWTQSALIASLSGVPYNYWSYLGETPSRVGESFTSFAPNLKMLPDILKEDGYHLMFLKGASIEFSGTKLLLSSHGFGENIYGLENLRNDYPLDLDNTITHWGYNDEQMFEIFKQKFMQNFKEPFMSVIFTLDTHNGNFMNQNTAFDIIRQTDKTVASFLKWFQMQPFYKDTVIVLVGDHLHMLDEYSEYLKNIPNTNRFIFNTFINGVANNIKTKREFSQIDLFPTILEAMGYKIEGHRLGLGTSIFSNRLTFLEELGNVALTEELKKKNKLYLSLWK